MNISEYVEKYKTKTLFCQAVGIKPQYLSQIIRGTRPIPPKVAIRLNKIHGADLHDMRPDIYPRLPT